MAQTTTCLVKVGGRDYTFQKELFGPLVPELQALFKENHGESSVVKDLKLDPDFDRYASLEDSGYIQFMTIRWEAEIVGYCLFYVDEEIRHQGVISATQDMMYISKKHRGMGYGFMKFCDDILKECGVNVVWRQATCFQDIGKMFERMGYVYAQKSYVKRF